MTPTTLEIPIGIETIVDPNVIECIVELGDWGPYLQLPLQDDFDEWLQSADCLTSLQIIGENSRENWVEKPHETIQLDIQDTAHYTLFLTQNAIIYYFTDRCPNLQHLEYV